MGFPPGRAAPMAACALVFLLLVPRSPVRAEPGERAARDRKGRAALSLSGESLEALLRFEGEEGRAAFSLVADDDGAVIRGGAEAGGAEGEPFFAAGVGRAAGSLAILADPTSFAMSKAEGAPVAIDRGLDAATAVLGAGTGGLAVFALAAAPESGFVLRRGGAGPKGPSWGAGGFCLGSSASERGRCAAAAALSLRRGEGGGGGWEPEPPPDPAGLSLAAGVSGSRAGPSGRSLIALCASVGRHAAPGLAVRAEAESRTGPLLLRVAAARAGEGFRGLSGSSPRRALALAADARLSLRRAAALLLALRLESPRRSPGEPVLLGGSARFGVALPAGGRLLEPGLSIARKAGGDALCELNFGLSRRRGPGKRKLELSLEVDGRGPRGLAAGLEAGAGIGSARWGASLGLGFLQGGSLEAPWQGECSFWLALAMPGGESELRLEVEGPEGGFVLAPLGPGEGGPVFRPSLRYVTSF